MILEGVLVSLVAAAGALALHIKRQRARAWSRDWQQSARECGVTQVIERVALGMPVALYGRKGALEVRMTTYGDLTKSSGTRVVISGLPRALSLGRVPVSFLGVPGTTGGEVLGDEPFDAIVEVAGDPLAVRAVFDARTRSLARDLFGVRVAAASTDELAWPDARLSGGELTGTYADSGLLWRGAGEAGYLRDLLELAERLAVSGDLEARVAAVAAADPLPDVRLACLTSLVEERPRHPATRAALLRGLQDEDERVQLASALALGSEGRALLIEIAGREWSGDVCAARAVAELRGHLPAADVERALGIALRRGKEATIAACLESLAHRGASHLAPIGRVLAVETGGRAIAAARALGLSSAAEAEEPLVRALAHADPAARTAAATALGRVGTATGVAALRAAEVAHAQDDAFVRAARAAIASIRSRLTGEHGQLALASDAGEVSLTDDADGRVTLKDAP